MELPKHIVLVIDDEPEVTATVSRMLHQLGFGVTLPAEPFSAAQIAEIQCDVVMTDMVMAPGVTGVDVIRAVRARQPGLPIIAFSGKAPTIEKHLGDLAGADDFLEKPFTIAMLRESLIKVLAKRPPPC